MKIRTLIIEKIFSKEYAINTRIEDFTIEHDYFPDPLSIQKLLCYQM